MMPVSGTHPLNNTPALVRLFELLRAHCAWPIVIGLLAGVTAFVMSLQQQPVYRATTTIEVQAINENYLNMRDVNPLASVEANNPDTFLDT